MSDIATPKRKWISFLILFLVLTLLPLLMAGVRQNQDIRNRAYQSDPIINQPVLFFEYNNNLLELKLNTHTRTIDGVQLIAYLPYGGSTPAFLPAAASLTLPPPPAYLNIITNSIIDEPDRNRFKIKFTALTQNPSQPFSNQYNYTIASIPLIQQASHSTVLIINRGYTKVIDHVTGQDLITVSPPSNIDINPSTNPTSTPGSPLPTVTPTIISPIPTASSTANINFSLRLSPEGVNSEHVWLPDAPIAIRPDDNSGQWINLSTATRSVFWDTNTGNYVLSISAPLAFSVPYVVHTKINQHLSSSYGINVSSNGQTYNYSSFLISTGDISGDNIVDIEDYHHLAISFDPLNQASGRARSADLTYDNYVDVDDYNLIVKNFDPERPTGYLPPEFY